MLVNRYLPFSDEYRSITVTNGSSQKQVFLKKKKINNLTPRENRLLNQVFKNEKVKLEQVKSIFY